MKAQGIRLIDIFLLGPWLMYLARRGKMSVEEADVLWLVGLATILYNGHNYLVLKRRREDSGEVA